MSTPKNTPIATPRPWRITVGGGTIIGPDIAEGVYPQIVCGGADRGDQELIVRAVNAHEALVSALTETLRALRAHIASDAARTGIVAEYFCPCTKNEVARAEAALRAARGES